MFGQTSGTVSAGNLTLGGNSTFTYHSTMWILDTGNSLIHTLDLSGHAVLTGEGAGFYRAGTAVLDVNFAKTMPGSTQAMWKIPAAQSFNQSYIQYQIDGVNTTLEDERFIQTISGDYNTLTIIPEPASLLLMGLGYLVIAMRRRAQ